MFALIILALLLILIVIGVSAANALASINQQLKRIGDIMERTPLRPGNALSGESASQDSQVEALVRQGLIMEAIKLVEEQSGLGFRDAKDAVESVRRRLV